RGAHLSWLAIAAQRGHSTGCNCAHLREDGVCFGPIEIIRERNGVGAPPLCWIAFANSNDAVCVRVGQWLQQHDVYDAENDGRGGDSKSQRQRRAGRKKTVSA